mgnify:CR=1 FL=1
MIAFKNMFNFAKYSKLWDIYNVLAIDNYYLQNSQLLSVLCTYTLSKRNELLKSNNRAIDNYYLQNSQLLSVLCTCTLSKSDELLKSNKREL